MEDKKEKAKVKGILQIISDSKTGRREYGPSAEGDLNIRKIFLSMFGSLTIPGLIKGKKRKPTAVKQAPEARVLGSKTYKGSRETTDKASKRIEYDSSVKYMETVSYPRPLPRMVKGSEQIVPVKYSPRKLRIRLDRRRVLMSPLRKSILGEGIVIDYRDYSPDRRIAILPTIISASLKGHFTLENRKIRIDDIKTRMHRSYVRLAIMVVLDASLSMSYVIPKIMDLLEALKIMAWRKRDKIGLVVCAGDTAQVLAHPTTNINVLKRKFDQIKMGGRTALATGMLKALRILHLEGMRNEDILPVLLVISDGLANAPLEMKIPDKFYEMCPIKGFADALYVAYLIRRKKIPLIALNPFHEFRAKPIYNWTPTRLMQTIADITNGIYIGLHKMLKPSNKQILNTILMAINRIVERYR